MKKVKIITIILAIILITMIAFMGIYQQVQNRMENKIIDYSYSRDLKGSRIIGLKIKEETETIIKDSEGNKVEDAGELSDEQLTEKGYTKEEVTKNEELKNIENYKKSKKIIEERLKKTGIDDYTIKLDETTGAIIIEMPENTQTDTIVSNIGATGKFEILDTDTNEVLMNNSDIKQARVMYGQTSANSQATSVYLEIKFNKEGTKKLEEITNKYVKVEEEQEDNNEENSTEEENTTSEENTQEENATNEENTTSEENAENQENSEEDEKKEKTITMKIDDSEIMSTSFDEPIKTGTMQLTVGSSTTDAKTLQDNVNQASNIANILDTGNLPIEYEVEENKYIQSDITDNEIQIAKYVVLGILAIGFIILIIRYKGLGILGVFSYIGLASILMLVIRYANVVLSIEGILGIIIVLFFNYAFINKLLSKLNKKEENTEETKNVYVQTYQEFFVKILPVIIMVITFCFVRWVPISSFGMVMFWGILLIAIYNSIITNNLFKIKTKKQN